MTLLLKSDLGSANQSKLIKTLTNDIDDTDKLIGAIQSFIDSSTNVLIGESFNAVRSHMQVYIDLLSKRKSLAQDMIESIKVANDHMTNYMEDESRLNTSEKELVRNKMNSYYSSAEAYDYRYKHYDSSKERVTKTSLLNMYYDAVNNAKKQEKLLKLLENLDAEDASTHASLVSTEDDISSFKTNVGGISCIKI